VKKKDLERLQKQVGLRALLDAIHREEGAWT
jgi:hypothetical protein